MKADEMRKDGIREWLLAGGGGFEGTPEASTFSFEGLIDYIDAFAMLAVDEALAREAGEPRNPEGALTPVGEENRLKQGTPPCCEFEWLGNRCSLPEGHEADHEIYDARRGEGMSELKVASRDPSSEAGLRDERYYDKFGRLNWTTPVNVEHLILQLQTLPPEMKVSTVTHINTQGKSRARAYGVSMSHELWEEDGWLKHGWVGKPELEQHKCLAIWASVPYEGEPTQALAKEARGAGARNATSCVVGIAIEPQHAPPGQPEIVKDCPGYQCLCCNRPSIYALQMRYVLSPLCNSCIKALREELAARDVGPREGFSGWMDKWFDADGELRQSDVENIRMIVQRHCAFDGSSCDWAALANDLAGAARDAAKEPRS